MNRTASRPSWMPRSAWPKSGRRSLLRSAARVGPGIHSPATPTTHTSARNVGVQPIEAPTRRPECATGWSPSRSSELQRRRTGRLGHGMGHGTPRRRSHRRPRPGGDLAPGRGWIPPDGHRLGRSLGLTAPRPRRPRPRRPLPRRPLLCRPLPRRLLAQQFRMLHRYPAGSPKRGSSPPVRPIESHPSHLR
jgi:hypothetical protein